MSGAQRWRGRRVLVTGHTGFKGGWLTWLLAGLGARLYGYSLPAPSTHCLYRASEVAGAYEREWFADVRDAFELDAAMKAAQPEVLFHLAAQPLVRLSYAEPLQTFGTNVMGTAHVLEAARHCGSVRAAVVVTSDKCYRDLGPPCREGDALGGHDPYSASKACAEMVATSYAQSFQLPQRGLGVATARAGNVVGGGDWSADRLVPDLLRAIDSGQVPNLRCPDAVRPWQHVLDPLAGYVQLAEHLLAQPLQASGAWNFGPNPEDVRSVQAVANQLLALAQGVAAPGLSRVLPMQHQGAPLHEAQVLQLDSNKARTGLGWHPRYDIDATLHLTWEWHQAWRRGADVRQLTLQQIEDLMGMHDAR